jgi:hypothetical protein
MMACMKLRTLAVVIAVASAAAAGGCSSAPAASHPPAASGGPAGYWTQSRLLAATPWREPGYQPGPSASAPPSTPGVRVGALFEHDASGNHFCTASVVASPGRDLLITVAHCINGGKGGATARTSCSSPATGIIGGLPAKPVVIGHSFGGLIVQRLLGQDLAAAGVAIDPAPVKGVALPPCVRAPGRLGRAAQARQPGQGRLAHR